MKVKSPLTFHNKAGEIVALGDVVDDSELQRFGLSIAPTPYETKVIREEPAAPRAVTSESIKPAKKAAKPAAKKSAAKKAK